MLNFSCQTILMLKCVEQVIKSSRKLEFMRVLNKSDKYGVSQLCVLSVLSVNIPAHPLYDVGSRESGDEAL